MKKIITVITFSIFVVSIMAFPCLADNYPAKDIQVLIPYGAGGGSDLGTRILTKYLNKYMDVSFVPVYKPGAGTTIAFKQFMKSEPDGYTIMSGAADVSVNFYPKVIKGANYGLDAATPIFGYSEVPMILAVKADAPWKSLEDFLADAKKHPNKLKHGSYGATSMSHFCMELINQRAGTKTLHVPFKSTGKALTALLGGHVDIVPATSLGGGLYKAGKIRVLAAALPERTPLLPDVPTLTELGYPVVMSFEYMVWVPNGTPQNIQDALTNAAKRVYDEHPQELAKEYGDIEMTAKFLDQKACKRLISERDKQFDYVIKLLNVPTYNKK